MESFRELMDHYGLREKDCKKQISDDHLASISLSHCKHWRKLPAHLGLETIVAEDIDRGPGDEGAKRHTFFFQWRDNKGFKATYEELITALLKINSTQDAESVCKIMQGSQQVSSSTAPNPTLPPPDIATGCATSIQPDAACSIYSLDPDTYEDLKIQLEKGLINIMKRYTSYTTCILESLQDKGVSVKKLCFGLLSLPAFNNNEQKITLLYTHEAELKRADDLYDIFDLLRKEYASFLNYDIFRMIMEKYKIDNGQEELTYPEHLADYIRKLKISEFMEINPLLKKVTSAPKKLVLKVDMELIESTTRLANLKMLKTTIAKILDLGCATLQLIDVKTGCVVVTFLVPIPVAECLFNEHTILTEKQRKAFRAVPVLWLKCNGYTFLKSNNYSREEQLFGGPRPQRSLGRVGMSHGSCVHSSSSSTSSTPSASYSSYDRGSSTSGRTYVHNPTNRMIGRVREQVGSHVVHRDGSTSGSTTSFSGYSSSSSKTYVDNSTNRSLGRVGKPVGSHVVHEDNTVTTSASGSKPKVKNPREVEQELLELGRECFAPT